MPTRRLCEQQEMVPSPSSPSPSSFVRNVHLLRRRHVERSLLRWRNLETIERGMHAGRQIGGQSSTAITVVPRRANLVTQRFGEANFFLPQRAIWKAAHQPQKIALIALCLAAAVRHRGTLNLANAMLSPPSLAPPPPPPPPPSPLVWLTPHSEAKSITERKRKQLARRRRTPRLFAHLRRQDSGRIGGDM